MELTTAGLVKEAKAFHLKKRLGQHFLVSVDALRQIAGALNATASDTVVEIGPGLGFLTRVLVETGAQIVAVDLDRESIERLGQMNLKNVELKHGDFLGFDLNTFTFIDKHAPAGEAHTALITEGNDRIKIVGNVPYQITGLILGHILGEIDEPSPWLHRVDNIVLTVQKEVAERMVAAPGTDAYSKVSLLITYFCESELLQILPADDFYPPPEVRSAVIRLVPRAQPAAKANNIRLLKKIIEAGFRQRRKMLRNSLSFLHLPQSEIDALFRKLSIDPQVRAERLSIQQFAMLADAIDAHLKTHAQSKSTGTSEG